MYKIILSIDEALTIYNYIGLYNFYSKDENIKRISQIFDRHLNVGDVIFHNNAVLLLDEAEINELICFIKEQINGPLRKYDKEKEIFSSVLDKLYNPLPS
ncbi:MAG TPA: hypothetical protein PLF27_10305 [Sedimentibacter sp.]|nr:hypothetical protein [Sedimentibacter sp.]